MTPLGEGKVVRVRREVVQVEVRRRPDEGRDGAEAVADAHDVRLPWGTLMPRGRRQQPQARTLTTASMTRRWATRLGRRETQRHRRSK